MGCKSSTQSLKELTSTLKSLIDLDNSQSLSFLLKQELLIRNAPHLLNSLQISHLTYKFSLIGYSLFTNKPKCFSVLLSTFKCSPSDLILSFNTQNLNPVHKLCELGALQILTVFFPLYLEECENYGFVDPQKTPLHVACKAGNVAIVDYLLKMYKTRPSYLTDLQFVNKKGKNAAAVALLAGKYSCFKFVMKESQKIQGVPDPIQECIIRSSVLKSEFLECAMYLVQNCGWKVSNSHLELNIHNQVFGEFLRSKLEDTKVSLPSSLSTSLSSN